MNRPEPRPLPEHVHVSVKGPSPDGLAISLYFEMSIKNNYGYLVFLGPDGAATISKQELTDKFDVERNAFIMDYVDPRRAFTGKITARVLGVEEIVRALEAFELYREYLLYPTDYEKHLRKALSKNSDSDDYSVSVTTTK
jgi:hypothetical protein